MLNFFKSFANDEAGAVTVDWVVLTAAIVGIGLAALSQVSGSVDTLAGNIETGIGTVNTTYDTVNAN